MGFSYDPALTKDGVGYDVWWVRFMIGDRTAATHKLEDEEIAAVLAEEANKYLAAARCGRLILSRYGTNGITSKSVDGLSISYDQSPGGSYGKYLDDLHRRGCELLYPKPRPFQLW